MRNPRRARCSSPRCGVHGQIDRIDLGPAGEALVQDYKSGGKVDGGAEMLEKRGKLSFSFYMLAARELWGHELAAASTARWAATGDRTPKGLLRKELAEELAGLDPRRRTIWTTRPSSGALEEAQEKAEEIIASVHSGEGDPRPARWQLPRLLRVPADLPAGARAAGGGALVRGG